MARAGGPRRAQPDAGRVGVLCEKATCVSAGVLCAPLRRGCGLLGMCWLAERLGPLLVHRVWPATIAFTLLWLGARAHAEFLFANGPVHGRGSTWRRDVSTPPVWRNLAALSPRVDFDSSQSIAKPRDEQGRASLGSSEASVCNTSQNHSSFCTASRCVGDHCRQPSQPGGCRRRPATCAAMPKASSWKAASPA